MKIEMLRVKKGNHTAQEHVKKRIPEVNASIARTCQEKGFLK
jgi:hypothetical protein